MFQSQNGLLHRGIQACDLLIVGSAVWLSTEFAQAQEPAASGTLLIQSAIHAAAFFTTSYWLGFYRSRRTENFGRELRQLAAVCVISLSIATFLTLTVWGSPAFHPPAMMLGAYVGIALSRGFVRIVLSILRSKGWNYRQTVIVGRGSLTRELTNRIQANPRFGIRMLGSFYLPGETAPLQDGLECLGPAEKLQELLLRESIDSVVLCPSASASSKDTLEILEQCDQAGVHCHYSPCFLRPRNLRSEISYFGQIPTLSFRPAIGTPLQLAIKRIMDFCVATIGLALTAPIFLAIAIAIKLTDRGPIFFRQIRLGKDGRRFHCFKFRSMRVNADGEKALLQAANEADGPAFKIDKDPRITKIGAFLRKYSLDELPQLINVLIGDMSLVGPRPPVPDEVIRYRHWQRRRISVRPGITCVWQVQGRHQVSFDEWMKMDLFYIDNWSLWMDIKLIMRTMPAVVKGTGS